MKKDDLKAFISLISIIFPLFIGITMSGCASMVPPVELRAKTPDLSIDASIKRNINLAIVIPDPMAYAIIYEVPATKYTRDLTSQYRSGGLYLERELSKISSETFSQVFSQVTVVRDMPQSGQYDAVAELKIGRVPMLLIRQPRPFLFPVYLPIDMTAEWSMTVVDRGNREIFSKKGVSSLQSFELNIFRPSDWGIAMGQMMSPIISELAKEWAITLYSLEAFSAAPSTGGENR
ncbi:MAG: hypothetical protein KKI12_10640 [Proteobacteria bacterium]|nr:hypothetical protein [Pseudomonadota bacterium]MBU4259278.1 hypothetical protein [Pseudomonadota bacterium]MBU4288613.1 hypothetical protein [Pseudomonadota bacterium]MBU4393353.1 hypothetical protein [Actinomycetota bacterium]MCG2757939.1 hypothetical protein [Desulfobacteraceae bacterium]